MYSSLKGRAIRYDYIENCELSRDLFIDQNEEQTILSNIENNKPLLFLPNYVQTLRDYINYNKNNSPSVILLIGTLQSGSKASIVLTDIPIYFDIFCYTLVVDQDIPYCPNDIDFGNDLNYAKVGQIENIDFIDFLQKVKVFDNHNKVLKIKYICKKIQNIGATHYNKHIGCRLYFKTDKEMKAGLAEAYKYTSFFVTSNNTNMLQSIFVKTKKYCGSWMVLNRYRYYTYCPDAHYNKYCYTKAKHNFYCHVDDFLKPSKKNLECFGLTIEQLNLLPGKSLELSWDVETTEVKDDKYIDEDIDDPNSSTDKLIHRENQLINICAVVTTSDKPKQCLLKIGLFRPACKYCIKFDNEDYDIMCRTQKELILGFAKVIELLQPDIMITYNGNNFDVPIYLLQARLEGAFFDVYSMTSLLVGDNTKNKKPDKYGYYSNDGYTFWSRIHTIPRVSGITKNKKSLKPSPMPKKMKYENEIFLNYHYWTIPGCIHVDLYLIARKVHKKEKSHSLSAILKKNKINISKFDVPYSEIWKRWRNSADYSITRDQNVKKLLQEIDDYCKQDCFCTYLLYCGYQLLPEKRAMCRYTYLPLEDTIYFADGIKVSSGLGALYIKNNYVYIDNRPHHIAKNYEHLQKFHDIPDNLPNEGAYVEIHKRGKIHSTFNINGKKYKFAMPVDALDVQSMYPNIMIQFNLSLDCISYQKPLNCDEFLEHFLPDLPEELTYVKDKTIWIKNHNNVVKDYGIVPQFLDRLFSDRKKIKAQLANIQDQIDDLINQTYLQFPKDEYFQTISGTIAEKDEQYEKYCKLQIIDQLNYLEQQEKILNAFQLTMKILMNTVYGVTKFQMNTFYCYFIAHITTKKGREIIQHVNNILIDKNCTVNYNDTDSAYYNHHKSQFYDIAYKYITENLPEIVFRRKMTHRSFKLTGSNWFLKNWYSEKLKKHNLTLESNHELAILYNQKIKKYGGFQDFVNSEVAKFVGGNRIQLAREETNYPIIFLAKKKYFGLMHTTKFVDIITESNLLVKGISYVTRQTPNVIKNFNKNIMLEILNDPSIDCEEILIKNVLKSYYNDYPLEDYQITFTYKPSRNNARVIPFIKRMKLLKAKNQDCADLYKIPDPLEVFAYAITRVKITRTLRGTKKDIKVTDKAEYIEVIKKFGFQIDKEHYLLGLASTYSQFLTYRKDFDFYNEEMSVKEYKEKIQKKYVEKKLKEIINSQDYIIEKNRIHGIMSKTYNGKIITKFYKKFLYTYYPDLYQILISFLLAKNKRPFSHLEEKILALSEQIKNIKIDPELVSKYSNYTEYDISVAKIQNKILSPKNGIIYYSSEEYLELEKKYLYPYEAFYNSIYAKFETAFFEYFTTLPTTLDIESVNLQLSEQEINILSEMQENIYRLITFRKYILYNSKANKIKL